MGSLVAAIMLAWYNPHSALRASVKDAASLLYSGRYTEALPQLERALPYSDTPQTRLLLSYAYLARRDAARAEVQARAAISNSKDSLLSEAWAQLGRVLAYSGRDEDALTAWQKAIQQTPDLSNPNPTTRSAQWHTAMGQWRHGSFDTSLGYLTDLLAGNDIYAVSARVKLAQFYAPTDSAHALQLLSEADAMLGSAESMAANGVRDFTFWGGIPDLRTPNLREGLSAGVIARLSDSLRAADKEAVAAQAAGAGKGVLAALWGSAYLQQGEPALAKRYLEEAVGALPRSSDAHARLGLALLAGGDADGALPHLQTAVQLDSQNPLPRHALTSIYIGRKDWDHAAEELRTLRKLEPNGIAAHLEVADYYKGRGQYEEAEANLKEAAQTQRTLGPRPGDVDASLALARFYTDVRGQGCAKGLPAAQDSVMLHPDDPDSLDALGWAFVLCGDASPAIRPLEQSVSQAPEVPRFRYHLAKAYALAVRKEDARTQFTRVMDLDPTGQWERLAQADMVGLGER